jgi:hypothetical protein
MTGENRLPVLAAEIADAHQGAAKAIVTSLSEAMRAGERLLEAKALVRHGEWRTWVAGNLPFSERTASRYMRLTRHRDLLEVRHVADLTIAAAGEMLAEARPDVEEMLATAREDIVDAFDAVKFLLDATNEHGSLKVALHDEVVALQEAISEGLGAICRRLDRALQMAVTPAEVRSVHVAADQIVGIAHTHRQLAVRYRDAIASAIAEAAQ